MSAALNLEAERAAGITDAEIAGIMGWRGPGAYTEATLRKIKRILEQDRARRTARAVGADGLPALPEPVARMYVQNGYRRASVMPGKGEALYTAEQYRQGQRDAVAADRQAQQYEKGQK